MNSKSINLSNLISLESIIIGDNCFRQVKSFELNGLNKLRSLRIGNKPYTQDTIGNNSFYETTANLKCDASKYFHILNCESLTSIEIGSSCFNDFGGVFKLEHLNSLQSIIIGKRKNETSCRSGNVNSNYMFYSTSLIIQGTISIIF